MEEQRSKIARAALRDDEAAAQEQSKKTSINSSPPFLTVSIGPANLTSTPSVPRRWHWAISRADLNGAGRVLAAPLRRTW